MDVMKDGFTHYEPECILQTNSLNQMNVENQTFISNNSGNVPRINSPSPSDDQTVIINMKEIKKKGRKEKSNKSQWRKEKGNKYLNKPYRNYKGIEIKSKEFLDYDCKCQMKCRETLTANDRKQEFQKFWELGSYEAQAIFLIARVDEQVTKKSSKVKKKDTKEDSDDSDVPEAPDKSDSSSKSSDNNKDSNKSSDKNKKQSKRQFSRTYILKSKQVCRNMFVKTLGITSKRINTALVKMRSKSLIDHRGLSQGGKNKISEKRYDEVVDHIKKMPRYRCTHIQGKLDLEFLPPELSLSKMYDLYTKEVESPVSLSMYKKIYYGKFNFKLKGVKKEICNICKGERKMKNETIRKQLERVEHRVRPAQCQSHQNNQVVLQEPYRPHNFMPPPVHCNQAWLPTHNFQMPPHNPAPYFEQPMGYE